jgi:hypothetical protein
MTTSSFGQIMSYMTSLKTSDSGITVAELSLIHRSRSNSKDIRDLGTRMVLIPNQPNGKQIDIEQYRFRTMEGSPFEMNNTVYVPVHLYHDNKTNDPRDDIYLLSIPFPVTTELALEELSHYEGQELISSNFEKAPKGKPNYELEEKELIKKNKD